MHTAIEVIVSLIGLYIVFSIINSAIVEWIMQLINKRGKFLKKNLDTFFSSGEGQTNISDLLYESDLIKAFKEKGTKNPSWIDKKVFAQSLMQIVMSDPEAADLEAAEPNVAEPKEASKDNKENVLLVTEQVNFYMALLPEDLKKSLNLIVQKAKEKAGNTLNSIQEEIEDLYEAYMERVTEWYKKRMKIILGVAGFLFALLFNLDSIHFTKAFFSDAELRKSHVMLSRSLAANEGKIKYNTTVLDSIKGKVSSDKEDVAVILISGFNIDGESTKDKIDQSKLNIGLGKILNTSRHDLLFSILGIFTTGLALSFGSTFWFDLLKKILKPSSTG